MLAKVLSVNETSFCDASQNCAIYLLDDPFSAVDSCVASHIWHNVVIKLLKRTGKTVILATHHEKLASQADYVLRLNPDGTTREFGTYFN